MSFDTDPVGVPLPNNKNAPTAFSEPLKGILDRREDYLRIGDPTEYQFVKRVVGSWSQWVELLKDETVAPIIENWREELAIKLSSEALRRILDAAQGETRDALSANKYIYEALSPNKDKTSKVGRPSRDAITKEALRLFEDEKIKTEAFNRVFNKEIS